MQKRDSKLFEDYIMLENWCSKSLWDPEITYLVFNQLPPVTQLKSILVSSSQVLQTIFFQSKT